MSVLYFSLFLLFVKSQYVCLSGNPPANGFIMGEYIQLKGDVNGKPAYYLDNTNLNECTIPYIFLFWWKNYYFVADVLTPNYISLRKIRMFCYENNVTDISKCQNWAEYNSPPKQPILWPNVKINNGQCIHTKCNQIQFTWNPSIKNNVCQGIYNYIPNIQNAYIQYNVSYSPTKELYLQFNRKLNRWYCGDSLININGCSVQFFADEIKGKIHIQFILRC